MQNQNSGNSLNRREFLKKSLAGGGLVGAGLLGFPAIAFPKTDIKIGYIPILDHLTLLVSHARDNNAFKHIQIEPKLFKSWSSVAGALNAGVIEGAMLLSNFAMDLFNKRTDISTILVGHRHGSGITVSKDSNLLAAADLKGKRIAIPTGISTHTALLDAYLRTGGLSLQDVETKVIAPSNMVQSMQRGRIDAFIVAEPFCARAEAEGAGNTLVLSKDISNNHICCVAVVKKEILQANPEGIQEWVNSMVVNGQFIEQDKVQQGAQNVARIATQYMKHPAPVMVNALTNPLNRITYDDLNPRLSDYQAILDLSLKAGIMQEVDLKAFIDDSFYHNSSASNALPGLKG